MTSIPENLRREVKRLISSLVSDNLSDMHSQGLFGKSDLDVISEVINSYPGTMTMPPDSAFLNFDVYGDIIGDHFSADFPLWFDDVQSDLYALIAQKENAESVSLYIHDLRVP